MSWLPFKDISVYQGNYDMGADPNPLIFIKVSGGDNGTYYDSRATANYNNAINAGKAVGMYHFAGGTDAVTEADFFIRACSPLAENDVLALDWEVGHPDPVGWCTTFVNRVHDQIGVWPLLYMNISTANAHDWSPVLNNCGYWCAAPSFSFDEPLPVKYTVVAQQGPIVDGVDTDAWFGTLDQFKAYGYHAPQTAPPAPEPAPQQPVPVPDTPPPITLPEPAPEEVPDDEDWLSGINEPEPAAKPSTPPIVAVTQPQPTYTKALLIRAGKTFVQAFLASVLAGVATPVNMPTLSALGIAAFAAAFSAAMNTFLGVPEVK